MPSMVARHFRKTLDTAGTAQRVYDGPETNSHKEITNDFLVTALSTNTGNMYVGDSVVDNTARPLIPGATINFSVNPIDDSYFKLSDVFFDGDTSGNIVIITYLSRND